MTAPIVVAGGTGLLGRDVVARLVGRGVATRVVTRDLERARAVLGPLAAEVELVVADVRDPSSLRPVVAGGGMVVAAVTGFGGHDAGGMGAVDLAGNRNLVEAAASAGIDRFILLSIHGTSMTDALPLGRAKAAVETALRETTMRPTLVRPTTYMETWAGIIGGPILANGRARLFGRGRNPINFVSAADVAEVVETAILDDAAAGRTIEVVGPEDISFDGVVALFSAALGTPVPTSHVPLAVLRAMSVALRPVRSVLADQAAAAIVLDTTDRRAASHSVADSDTVRQGSTTFEAVIAGFVGAVRSTAVRAGA
jgi:uncharacterized protein YbjT (DUF2867 family)